jgi:regulatory protein
VGLKHSAGLDSKDAANQAKCYGAAVRLLGTREYSVVELTTKLQRRFLSEVVNEVTTELQALGLLCNTRYGEAFCRSRVERGYGPVFMQRELEQNGLNKELIETLLEPYDEQWLANAILQVEKKARTHRPADMLASQPHLNSSDNSENTYAALDCGTLTITGEAASDKTLSRDQQRQAWHEGQKERARIARFLARRGFPAGVASRAINQVMQAIDR